MLFLPVFQNVVVVPGKRTELTLEQRSTTQHDDGKYQERLHAVIRGLELGRGARPRWFLAGGFCGSAVHLRMFASVPCALRASRLRSFA